MVVNGIVLEPRLLGAPIADGRKANGFELVESVTAG